MQRKNRQKKNIHMEGKNSMDYKKKIIIELIEKINEESILEFIYDILSSFKERWGI